MKIKMFTATAALVAALALGGSAAAASATTTLGDPGAMTAGQTYQVPWTVVISGAASCNSDFNNDWSVTDGETGNTDGVLANQTQDSPGSFSCTYSGSFAISPQTAGNVTVQFETGSFTESVTAPAPPTTVTPGPTAPTGATGDTGPSDPALQAEIDQLNAELAALQAQFADLETRVQRLEGANDAAEAQYQTDIKLGLSPQQAALDAESQALNFLYKLGAFAPKPTA